MLRSSVQLPRPPRPNRSCRRPEADVQPVRLGVGDTVAARIPEVARGRRGGVLVDRTRVDLGENDGPMEDELTEAFDRIVSEGAQRLHRTWREVLTTGLAGG